MFERLQRGIVVCGALTRFFLSRLLGIDVVLERVVRAGQRRRKARGVVPGGVERAPLVLQPAQGADLAGEVAGVEVDGSTRGGGARRLAVMARLVLFAKALKGPCGIATRSNQVLASIHEFVIVESLLRLEHGDLPSEALLLGLRRRGGR